MLVVNIIIGLYGTPADRQAVLRLAWYIRLIRLRFDSNEKKTIRRSLVVTVFLGAYR